MSEQNPKITVSALGPALLAVQVHDIASVDVVRSLPQRKYDARYRHWEVPAVDDIVASLKTAFKREEMNLTPDAAVVMKYVELRSKQAERKAMRRWEYVFDDTVPEIPYAPHTKAYKHQVAGLDALHGSEFFGLFFDMGTGKTKVVLDEIRWSAMEMPPGQQMRVLVVAPAGVTNNWPKQMKIHWPEDFKHRAWVLHLLPWATDQFIEYVRDKESRVKILVCSYDRVKILKDFFKKLGKRFDLMVIDESARIKNPYAQRTKAVKEIADELALRRFALTGSPVVNNILDVYAQFDFLSPGCLGFQNFHAFRAHYAELEPGRNGNDKVVGFKNLDELKERMARYSFVVKKDDCLDLPKKVYEVVDIEMGKKQAEMYQQMLEWMIASIDGDMSNAGGVTQASAMIAQLTRLRQIADGFIHADDGTDKQIEGATGKQDQLLDDLEDIDGKVLIWRAFRYDDEMIGNALETRKHKYVKIVGGMSAEARQDAEERFNNDPEIKALIGSPDAAGEGLTLLGSKEHRCATTIYWSNSFALGPRIQSEDRNHRIGQDQMVMYRDYCMADTIEVKVATALQAKRDLANEMTNIKNIKDLILGNVLKAV